MNDTSIDRRIKRFPGARNFRDLGGYLTADGQRVRWGQVFRAGHPGDMPADAHASFKGLGLACVIDLRSTSEREECAYAAALVDSLDHWYRDHELRDGNLIAMASNPAATAADAEAMMLAVYRRLPYEHADALKALFSRIVAGRVPLLINCTAGKDRTGTAAALVLTALGVPRATVIEDYVLTERLQPPDQSLFEHQAKASRSFATLARLPPEVLLAMMSAPRAWIEAMLDTLGERHGSPEGFLREVLGLDDHALSALRGLLLEPV